MLLLFLSSFQLAQQVSNTGKGKAGIKVLEFIESGGEISKEVKNTTISRIKFGVKVNTKTKKKLEEKNQNTNDGNEYFQ